MSRGMTRAERLREMERLYIDRAYSDIEMAERLGVDRTTVYRDRIALEDEYPFVEIETGRYRIDRSKYLSSIKVNLHEALALYLAARRVARQTRLSQPHVGSALEKLAITLRQPMTERLTQAATNILAHSTQPDRVKILEAVTQGWVEQRKVRISYQSLHAPEAKEHLVCPYLIEPSLWSEGVYLIAHSNLNNAVTTFKVERILDAYLTLHSFDIPDTFDDQQLLQFAWGIWSSEGDPVKVKLRFSPGQPTRRLKESIWHPTQEIEDLPDGGCLWIARVAEWQEMVPWVRGWGADVEVLEPDLLREIIKHEIHRSVQLYSESKNQARELIYYAHSKEDVEKTEWQLLKDHLINTSNLAFDFGQDAGIPDLAKIAGLFHDIGKYSQAFQKRLEGSNRRVDHSTAGAREIINLFQDTKNKKFAELLAYCLAGHHTGLPDIGSVIDMEETGTLHSRLKTNLEEYSAYRSEIDITSLLMPEHLHIKPIKGYQGKQLFGFSVSLLVRMVYSALVDADFQETETYISGKKPRGGYESIEILSLKFNNYLLRFENPDSEINRKRTETLISCIEKAGDKPGFYTLTVPTGGGKTLASMAFALNHACKNELKRVIYVIPFTSIIEQNAAVFKECLGEENVLEHHSGFDWEQKRGDEGEIPDNQTNSAYVKLKLATENWDIPIVVTTNVQFFESLFANRSSRCRKLHNIAKSVIIFDEAQMLPREYMYPALYGVWELVTNYGASVVFCTATQPALHEFLPDGTQMMELAPDPSALFDFYRRIEVKVLGKISDNELLKKMNSQDQVLCIVNTRRHAKGLFDGLKEDNRFHLSTLMCPLHRKETLNKIRVQLKSMKTCRVVSTQVMEAGIDVDFPIGFRSLAGLDSIIQAGGRVNREMKFPSSDIYVFEPDSEFVKRIPKYIEQGASVARSILREFNSDPVSNQAIEAYYDRLYSLHDKRAFDSKEILGCFEKSEGFDFKTAAERFQVIENIMTTIIIPYDKEAKELIEELKFTLYPASTLRKLQPYVVNIYEQEFNMLNIGGVIDMVADTYAVLSDRNFYHPETGLVIPDSSGGEGIFY